MSDLLNQASLVMIPSGYKEDVVYSQIPTDGAGDLSFTRASNGTRVNSAGLVEVCPWNLALQSEDFSNAVWDNNGGAVLVTANATTAPNGTTTADQVENNPSSSNTPWMLQFFTNLIGGQTYTYSVYAKASTSGTKQLAIWNNYIAWTYQNINVTTEWQRFEFTFVANASATAWAIGLEFNGAETAYFIWGAQLNIGSTAKPYFPTTDRLNVPRLTYQNGGGGCPSLLLEKQSTNVLTYSEQFDDSAWTKTNGNGGSAPIVTANYGVSPDGTQNADRIQLARTTQTNSFSYVFQNYVASVGVAYTWSVWLKSLSGTPSVALSYDGANYLNVVTLTTEWQRYTFTTNSASTGLQATFLLFEPNGTSLTADFLAWGAQLEASSYPTSYIPTTSSSATRVAEGSFTSGLSALIGQTEGTLFAIVSSQQAGSLYNWLNLSDNTVNNWVFIGKDSTKWRAYVKSNGSVIFDNSSISITNNTFTKIALAYKSGDIALYINGTQIATSSGTFTFSGTLSKVSIGDISNVVGDNAQYSEILVSKTRLTNAELASLTTI